MPSQTRRLVLLRDTLAEQSEGSFEIWSGERGVGVEGKMPGGIVGGGPEAGEEGGEGEGVEGFDFGEGWGYHWWGHWGGDGGVEGGFSGCKHTAFKRGTFGFVESEDGVNTYLSRG